MLSACGDDGQRRSFEDRLVDSFDGAEQAVQDRVQTIVKASNERNYVLAMNELGIISKTNINNAEQKQAINILMSQLRIAMEEEEMLFKKQTDTP